MRAALELWPGLLRVSVFILLGAAGALSVHVISKEPTTRVVTSRR